MSSHAASFQDIQDKTTVAQRFTAPTQEQLQPRLPTILPLPYVNPNNTTVDIPRQKRSKAKRSCDLCRKRRIRCNADTVQPCHGCKSVGADCYFRTDEQKQTQAPIESFEDRVSRLENLIQGVQRVRRSQSQSLLQLHQQQQQEQRNKDDKHEHCQISNTATKATSDSSKSTVEKEHSHSLVAALCGVKDLIPLDPTAEMIEHMSLLQLSNYEQTRYIGSSSGIHMLNQSIFNDNAAHRIVYDNCSAASWITQKVNHESNEHVFIKAEELRQSAPRIPKRLTLLKDIPHLTDELVELMVHSYFVYVQPNIPILNKLSFLEQYYFQNPHPPDQYLLGAVCVVATDFLHFQDDYVVGTNFDRKTIAIIKQALRDKVMKIMEVVYRRSRISTLQTLVLLAHFVTMCDENEEEDDSIHWIITGTAIRMAQDLGLHRSSSNWNLPEREIEHRRRLWYCLYVLDKWVAAALGRPVAIADEEFDVELPSPYEIDSAYHSVIAKECELKGPVLIAQAEACIRERRNEYAPFLSMITLSCILRRVLVQLYSPKAHNASDERSMEEVVDTLDMQLHAWRLNLPSELQFNLREALQPNGAGVVLYIFYNCVMILLHRPFIAGPDVNENSMHSLRSQSSCTTAALNIIDATETLVSCGAPCLPRSFLGYSVFQAGIIFILNAGSEDESVRRHGCRNLARCAAVYSSNGMRFRVARILNQLSKRYTDDATATKTVMHITAKGEDIKNDPRTMTTTVTSSTAAKQSDKKHNQTVTVPMLSSTSAEAFFVSSLPREIAMFNKLPDNNGLPRPLFQELTVNVSPPGPLAEVAYVSASSKPTLMCFSNDTNPMGAPPPPPPPQQQQQPSLNEMPYMVKSSSNDVAYGLSGHHHLNQHHPLNSSMTTHMADMTSTSSGMAIDDVFRQQQAAMSSAIDLLPIQNLPVGTYWTQEEWDAFLEEIGYQRPL
ncbi:fungal-specific transcription factor domain-containing protein [Zychaea mexicana]|uniref:fungal-specific transcription factor domain-containing protein n=1 Tax=Zychaea mexicana TaxID=64656 RepID=UPI0022FE5663|nr:fungal-specific transcription factor domain-containing protein [Zychaea mexicana]KAI9494485.1 fungal-specific transcription factor domain-containing protein [Zychaea mexicana]